MGSPSRRKGRTHDDGGAAATSSRSGRASEGPAAAALPVFHTEQRNNNREVRKLAEFLKRSLENTKSASPEVLALTTDPNDGRKKLEKMIERASLDFNMLMANDEEYSKWIRYLYAISNATPANGVNIFALVFQHLLTQISTFHDPEEYKDYGEGRSVVLRTPEGEEVVCKTKAEIKQRCIRIIQGMKLDAPLKKDSSDLKFLMAVLSYHPNAATKLKGVKEVRIRKNKKNGDSFRVITLIYEPEDGEERSDDISFVKCMQYIQDPHVDHIRDLLTDAIFRLFRLHYITKGSFMLEKLKKTAPPPEFQQMNNTILNARMSTQYVMNYLQFILGLMKRSTFKAYVKASVSASETSSGAAFIALECVETYKLYCELQTFVFGYLHIMETEKLDHDILETFDTDSFNFWLLEKAKELKKVVMSGKYPPEKLAQAQEMIRDRKRMYQAYQDVKTEDEIGPIRLKLDDVFCLIYRFYKEELTTKENLYMRSATYEKHYQTRTAATQPARITSPGCSPVNGPPSPQSMDSLSNPTEIGSNKTVTYEMMSAGGIMSDAGSAWDEEQGAASGTGDVLIKDLLIGHLLDTFETNCLSSFDSPILPALYFGIVNVEYERFGMLFLERIANRLTNESLVLQRPRRIGPASVVNAQPPLELILWPESQRGARVFDLKARAAGYLIGLGCHSRRMTAPQLQSIMSALTDEMLQLARVARLDKHRTKPALVSNTVSLNLIVTCFTGVLELMCVRWLMLKDDLESKALMRIMLILAFADDVFDHLLCHRTLPVVCKSFCGKVRRFDVSGNKRLRTLFKVLEDQGESIDIVDSHKWPTRTFGRVDLRNLSSYVQPKDSWLDVEEQGDLEEVSNTQPLPLGASASQLEDIWAEITQDELALVGDTQPQDADDEDEEMVDEGEGDDDAEPHLEVQAIPEPQKTIRQDSPSPPPPAVASSDSSSASESEASDVEMAEADSEPEAAPVEVSRQAESEAEVETEPSPASEDLAANATQEEARIDTPPVAGLFGADDEGSDHESVTADVAEEDRLRDDGFDDEQDPSVGGEASDDEVALEDDVELVTENKPLEEAVSAVDVIEASKEATEQMTDEVMADEKVAPEAADSEAALVDDEAEETPDETHNVSEGARPCGVVAVQPVTAHAAGVPGAIVAASGCLKEAVGDAAMEQPGVVVQLPCIKESPMHAEPPQCEAARPLDGEAPRPAKRLTVSPIFSPSSTVAESADRMQQSLKDASPGWASLVQHSYIAPVEEEGAKRLRLEEHQCSVDIRPLVDLLEKVSTHLMATNELLLNAFLTQQGPQRAQPPPPPPPPLRGLKRKPHWKSK